MYTSFTILVAVAGVASAQLDVLSSSAISHLLASLGPAAADDPRFTDYQPPGKDDGTSIDKSKKKHTKPSEYLPSTTVRSPCPGLNTLANHGFIPRNGRNNTIPVLLQGLAAGMNMGPDFTVAIGGAGLLASPDPFAGSFDLSDLDEHNFPIEHDSSMSRRDAYFGDDTSFYAPNWDEYMSFFGNMSFTDIPTASKAKFSRYNNSMNTNPEFQYGLREAIFSYGENAIYIQAMSDPESGMANLDYVRSLFEQEKLPYELGWRPSNSPITLFSIGQMLFELYGDSPEPGPEGAKIAA